MTNPRASRCPARGAFTLIELLVVIAIIAVLAALIFPAAAAIKRRATITKVQTELKQVSTAIDLYKEKFGFYPPDNPNQPAINQLYYELLGTVLTNGDYQALDGSMRTNPTAVQTTFGASGFVNCTKGAGGDDGSVAVAFLKSLKPAQYGEISTNSSFRALVCSVPWPANSLYQPTPNPGLNPWRYMSSAATNNPGAYDLWVDVLIAGKTNRFSNWSKQPQRVATP